MNACAANSDNDILSVGDWDVAVECAGPAIPNVTVWLEHGIGSRASSSTWDPVLAQIAEFAHVCRYDRPGAGQSAQSLSYDPNTFLARVGELMQTVGAREQLVVVGHSFGGYPARVLAQAWPDRVGEVILVDSVSEALGLRKATNAIVWSRVPVGSETIDVRAFEEEMNPRLDMPVTVISRALNTSKQWELAQKHLLALHSGGRFIIADRSGHMVPFDNPAVIVRAIRAAVNRLSR